ncbi:aldose 1-epimerase family protein [Streptococcus hongkongensis]|nr:protein lacX [Streptococcus uberis]
MALELKNDDLRLSFKEIGGELSSIKDKDGLEYLWQGDAKYWNGQAPVLFPICGSLRHNKTLYGANAASLKEGEMPRHGLVRKLPFIGEKLSDNQVAFTLVSTDDMYHNYPYHFELSTVYTLIEKTITVAYQLKNLETVYDMPFTIGAHPAFNCPLVDNEHYEDYYLEFSERENCTSATVIAETGLVDSADRQPFLAGDNKLNLDYSLFKDDTIVLDQLASKTVSLKSKNHQKGLSLNLLDFPNLILWSTANKGPFIALEPWCGMSTSETESDYFEEKQNMQFLEPYIQNRKVASYSYEITIL